MPEAFPTFQKHNRKIHLFMNLINPVIQIDLFT